MFKDMFIEFKNKCKKCLKINISHLFDSIRTTDKHGKEALAITLATAMLMSCVIWDTNPVEVAYAAENRIENRPHVIMAGETELAVVGSKAEAESVIQNVKAKYGATSASKDAIIDPQITAEPKTTVLCEKDPEPLSVNSATEHIVVMNSGSRALFKVIVTGDVIRTEVCDFETKTVKTSRLYKGESKVSQEGKKGEYIVKGRQTLINGKVVSENIYEKELVKKPVTKIIEVGTKERIIKGVATGNMIKPTSGSIVSGYGYRFGPIYGYEFHMGIDISAGYGQGIYAADGGTVVLASYHPSYGKQIVINHGNGLKTRYAHCSSLKVSVGDKVSKGDLIAGAGSTGASTGVHLHFEVLKGGSHTNPMQYI